MSPVPPGKLSGFGHIQFDTEEAVQRALKLHGADLMGRELFVDAAVNKPPDAVGMSGKAVEGCWFCLSNPNADVNLIASIGASAFTPFALSSDIDSDWCTSTLNRAATGMGLDWA